MEIRTKNENNIQIVVNALLTNWYTDSPLLDLPPRKLITERDGIQDYMEFFALKHVYYKEIFENNGWPSAKIIRFRNELLEYQEILNKNAEPKCSMGQKS